MATKAAVTVQAAAAAADPIYTFTQSTSTRINIPDGPNGAWVGWDANATSLPAGAVVTSVTVHQKATHQRVSDLECKLYNDAGTTWTIRSHEGGTATSFDQTKTDTTVFAGAAARQNWHYRVRDTVQGRTGYISLIELTINYKVPVTAPVQLADETASTTTAGDGQTVQLRYQITSSAATTVTLDGNLVTPGGVMVADSTHNATVQVAAGTNWYQRDFWINLPPQAAAGAYNVFWKIHGTLSGDLSVTKTGYLTINNPVAVRVPILMYHDVKPVASDQYTVTTAALQAELLALKAYHYTPVTLQQVMDYRAGIAGATLPAKPVVISFDDGYRSLYTNVYPILKAVSDTTFQAKATAFVITSSLVDADYAGNLAVTWPQLLEMQASGLLDVQSHTVTHPNLTTVSATKLATELLSSRQIIEQKLGKTVHFLVWPSGAYNATTETAAWQAGYFGALAAGSGVEPTSHDKWVLQRIFIDWHTAVDFDPTQPAEFFLTKVGESSFQAPLLGTPSVQYLDPATGTTRSQVQPGQAASMGVLTPMADVMSLDPDYPLSAFCDAIKSIIGWTLVVVAVVVLGMWTGITIGTGHLPGIASLLGALLLSMVFSIVLMPRVAGLVTIFVSWIATGWWTAPALVLGAI